MTARLIGGPDLRLRLSSLANVPDDFARTWAHDTAAKMRETAPNARRPESRVFTTKSFSSGIQRFRAAVYGAYWWIFVDRGTKAHDILGSGRRNPPNLLMFKVGGQTIFTPKVHHPRTRRVGFISRAAQGALEGSAFAEAVVKRWNRRRIGSHEAFL
jgi:hypothetical protein